MGHPVDEKCRIMKQYMDKNLRKCLMIKVLAMSSKMWIALSKSKTSFVKLSGSRSGQTSRDHTLFCSMYISREVQEDKTLSAPPWS